MKDYGFSEADLSFAKYIYHMMASPWWREHTLDPMFRKAKARTIGNLIHDISGKFTGYISVKAVRKKVADNSTKFCNEHYHSRQESGEKIIDLFYHRPWCTYDEFLRELRPLCSVHKVLSLENAALVPFQNERLPWYECYQNAGIELIKLDMTDRKMVTQKFLRDYVDAEPVDLNVVSLLID